MIVVVPLVTRRRGIRNFDFVTFRGENDRVYADDLHQAQQQAGEQANTHGAVDNSGEDHRQ